ASTSLCPMAALATSRILDSSRFWITWRIGDSGSGWPSAGHPAFFKQLAWRHKRQFQGFAAKNKHGGFSLENARIVRRLIASGA
ncbi:MAG: hypothetical protein ACOYNZ_19020, partial [Rhodoferax sp.]